jgi:hypothetical protein
MAERGSDQLATLAAARRWDAECGVTQASAWDLNKITVDVK